MGNHCKPEEEAFLKVLKDIDPENKLQYKKICMFEDSFKNLVTANRLGMSTVFIDSIITSAEEGVNDKDKSFLSATVPTLSDDKHDVLRVKLPQLFQ